MAFELTTLAPAPEAQVRSRIELRTARVAIIGLGYVGLPLAEAFAEQGYSVIGFDIDAEKIKRLRLKESYIGHIPDERIAELIDSERFEPTADPQCFDEADAIIICVPTPLTPEREPDLSYIIGTGQTLSRYLLRGRPMSCCGPSSSRAACVPAATSSWRSVPSVKIPAMRSTRRAAFRRWSAALTPSAATWRWNCIGRWSARSCRPRAAAWRRPARYWKTPTGPSTSPSSTS
jgi:threonine dehydrogenase-like Zn-dependent dehydrogenase